MDEAEPDSVPVVVAEAAPPEVAADESTERALKAGVELAEEAAWARAVAQYWVPKAITLWALAAFWQAWSAQSRTPYPNRGWVQ